MTSLKPQLEAIIYAAETPIPLEQIVPLVKDSVLAEAPEIDAAEIKSRVRAAIEELVADYAASTHGIEVRQVAGGYRMSTKPEQHDVVKAFAKSLKPPFRLSLPALETLAVIAYKQPVTVPEISEIRGVDSGGVIATLLDRKLITTAGRKAVIGRPILYKTSKEFLLRFGLKDIQELPSMEEFEKLLSESFQGDLLENVEAPATDAAERPAEGTEPAEALAEEAAAEEASESSLDDAQPASEPGGEGAVSAEAVSEETSAEPAAEGSSEPVSEERAADGLPDSPEPSPAADPAEAPANVEEAPATAEHE